MADRTPHDDDDHAWLLARERGEPVPTISEARARRYTKLGRLIVDLPAMPAGVAEREGWEQDVLAAIDADAGRPTGQSTTPAAVTDKPGPKKTTATTRHRRRMATVAAAAFAMAASVAVVLFMRRPPGVDPGQAGRSGSSTPGVEATRGVHVEQGRLGFDHAVHLYRSKTDVAHELRDGDTVMTGDRIRVSAMTSTDAHLYLGFCADQHLQMYPSQHGVLTRAGDLVFVPEGGELVLDSQPGGEVLYIIVSQNELSRADPDLAARIAAIGDGSKAVDCSASVDRLMKPGPAPTSNVLRGESVARQRRPRSRTDSPASPGLAGNPGDAVWYTADEASAPGTVVAADADGVAVVRYRFTHVARENIDDHAKTRDD